MPFCVGYSHGIILLAHSPPAGSEFLSSGKVFLKVERKPVDIKYLEHKKTDIAMDIAKAVDWMEQYNQETGAPSMNGNVIMASEGNFSLLHAAVSVGDLGLVKRLVDLGADPNARSEVGSAIYLASNLEGASKASPLAFRDIYSVLKGNEVTKQSKTTEEQNGESEGSSSDGEDYKCNDSPHQLTVDRPVMAPAPPPSEDPGRHVRQSKLQHELSHKTASSSQADAASLSRCELAVQHGLPRLRNQDWMAQPGQKRCHWFNKLVGCRYGRRCRNLHVRSPVSHQLNENDRLRKNELDLENVYWERALDAHGRSWVTAAHLDPDDNTICYVEGGPTSCQSSQGIYWYPNDSDALTALWGAVLAWQCASNKQGSSSDACGPHASTRQSAESHYQAERPRKRARADEEDCSTVSADPLHDMFELLLASPNYSTAHGQITGMPLRKNNWLCWEKDGSVTAQFTSPSSQLGGIHKAAQSFGGFCDHGAWWHKDEKSAKASAFLSFLELAAREGLVTSDLRHATQSGKKISFGGPANKRKHGKA